MYYVIQRHNGDPRKHYLAYSVPRYLSSEKSHNIIFEFQHDGSVKRKWAAKEDIVLLTDNYELFKSILEKLEHLKQSHLAKIDAAQTELNHEISSMLNAMQSEFETIKNNS